MRLRGGEPAEVRFGQRELDRRGAGPHDADNRFARLDPLVGIDMDRLDDAVEGCREAGILEQVERILVGRLHLHEVRPRSLVLLLRNGPVVEQPPDTLEVGTGLLIGRAVGVDLQLDVARVELGKQFAPLHLLALRDGDREHLPREFEGQIDGIVGCGQTDEILVDDRRIGCRLGLDRTHCIHRRGFAAPAAAQRQQKKQNEVYAHKKS